jgi:hypothetical protein
MLLPDDGNRPSFRNFFSNPKRDDGKYRTHEPTINGRVANSPSALLKTATIKLELG